MASSRNIALGPPVPGEDVDVITERPYIPIARRSSMGVAAPIVDTYTAPGAPAVTTPAAAGGISVGGYQISGTMLILLGVGAYLLFKK
jgi:hypothetical protein